MGKSIRLLKASLVVLASFFLLTFLFQNCSPVKFMDMEAASRALEAERLAMGIDVETVTVGLNGVPDLKLFFVVDNSGTMKQNQLNLSGSFGSMFDASANSLNKFDSTSFLLNTAQATPAFPVEKATLDKIAAQQKQFSLNAVIPQAIFDVDVRSAGYNTGYLPGDNIGYQIKSSLSPLSYKFLPAPVVGAANKAGQISLSNSIRKLASVDVSDTENEFKDRLAILNSERIPQVLVGDKLMSENYSIVDSESGLCAVARVLRNPDGYIKAGDLLSFTIVSDENDNDAAGTKCVQSVTQYNGTENLVDGECKFKQTQLTYQPLLQSTTQRPDDCKINSNYAYGFKFTYPVITYTTDVTYKYVKSAGVNTAHFYKVGYQKQVISYTTDVAYKILKTAGVNQASYFNLVYQKAVVSTSYQYLNTDISYYAEVCNDIYSDGIKTGTKCVLDPTLRKGTKAGDYTGANCYPGALSLNSKAVNDSLHQPVCVSSYKTSAACAASDPLCKVISSTAYTPVTKGPFAGSFDTASCLLKAQSYADFSKDPVCTNASTSPASCAGIEAAANCTQITAPVYDTKTELAVAGDKKSTDNCLTYAKSRSTAVTVTGDVTLCKLNSSISFSPVSQGPFAGDSSAVSAASCLAKASAYPDYVKNPVCTDASTNPATCVGVDTAANCTQTTAPVYDFKSENNVSGDKTADQCVTWAKTRSGNAVSSAADVSLCKLNSISTTTEYGNTLNFSDVVALDSGNTIAVGQSCGPLKALAYSKASLAIQAVKNDDCVITGLKQSVEIKELRTAASCSVQAAAKCTASSAIRNCSGALVSYSPVVATDSRIYNGPKVKEALSCSSLCSDSKLGACGANPPAGLSVAAYFKNLYGANTVCGAKTTTLETGKEILTGKLASQESTLCAMSALQEPRYFIRTKGPYLAAPSTVVEYVSGIRKDANNQDQVVPLIDYIKARVQALAPTNQFIFSALVRKSTDPVGTGGSAGLAYQQLIDQTKGQLDSVLSTDYSVALKELSRVIKSSLERSFILSKMRPDQIITGVALIKKDTKVVVKLKETEWSQNAGTLKISDGLEFADGDQFQVDFQNYIP